jgi:ABC-2 type transport system ATP-binding protein
MWEVVRDLAGGGVRIFLTTQYLEEDDRLADAVAVLDRGRIVVSGTPEELKQRVGGGHIRLRFDDAESFAAARRLLPVVAADADALTLDVAGNGSVGRLRALLAGTPVDGGDALAAVV